MIASHVGSEARLGALIKLLDSIALQTHPASRVLLGWSAGSPRLRAAAAAALEECAHRLPLLELLPSAQLSQFGHYKRCCLEGVREEPGGAFVLLSDDDDLWHGRSAETYARELERHSRSGQISSLTALCCPAVAQPRERADLGVGSPMEVDRLLARDDVETLSDCREYFCFCARLDEMRRFFAETKDAVVEVRRPPLSSGPRSWRSVISDVGVGAHRRRVPTAGRAAIVTCASPTFAMAACALPRQRGLISPPTGVGWLYYYSTR